MHPFGDYGLLVVFGIVLTAAVAGAITWFIERRKK